MNEPSIARFVTLPVSTAVLGVLLLGAPASAQGFTPTQPARLKYALYVIEPFDAGSTAYSTAESVNDFGAVTGSSTTSEARAFSWTVAGGAVDLGELPSSLASIGRDIAATGVVAGSSGTACLWPGVGTPAPIAAPVGAYSPFAYGLNESGLAVGLASITPNLTTGWVWSTATGTLDLARLGVLGASNANAINESNQIVGHRLTSNFKAYRFSLDVSALVDLGTLGGPKSEALGISDGGEVVGWALNANFNTRPFLWNEDSGMLDLGSLAGEPYDFGKATSINTARRVVGWSNVAGSARAFHWDPVAGMQDLNDLVGNRGDFVLVTANRISNGGWIVGNGNRPGNPLSRGFVLRPL